MSSKKAEEFTIDKLSADGRQVLRELLSESDRGAAVLGAAYLDDCLAALLATQFLDQSVGERFLEGPLQSSHSRAQLAYDLGFISKGISEELCRIRKIRNRFAHLRRTLRFAEKEISALCRKLGGGRFKGYAKDAKACFVITIVILSELLLWKADELGRSHVLRITPRGKRFLRVLEEAIYGSISSRRPPPR